MAEIGGLKTLITTTIDKFLHYEKWCRGEIEHLGDPQIYWPRNSEIEFIEARVSALSRRFSTVSTTAGWESHEAYLRRYDPQPAVLPNAVLASGNDSETFKVSLAKGARASILWLQHTLDYVSFLEQMGHDIPIDATPKRLILFVSASPQDLDALQHDIELRGIKEELERSRMRDLFRLEVCGASRTEDFVRYITNLDPEIVHFSGHGSIVGELYFEGPNREPQRVPSEALSALFAECANHVKCVVLNACYAEDQAQAIKAHIAYVIGMRSEISDASAITFSKGFYRALGSGEEYPAAFRLAVIAMRMEGDKEHATPVLLP